MLKNILKTYLIVAGVMVLLYAGYLSYVFYSLNRMEDISAEPYTFKLQTQQPLVSNKFIDALKIPSLKEKSTEVMRAYNRRVQLVDIIKERMELLRSFNRLSHEVESVVNRNINMIERDNMKIRKQYDNIVAFAEKQYAASLRDQYSPDAEDKAKLYARENEALLREVNVPVSFK